MGHLLHSFDSDKKMEWKKQRVADAKHRGDEDLPGPKKDGLAKKMDDTDTFSPILAVEADLARASKRSSVATHLKKVQVLRPESEEEQKAQAEEAGRPAVPVRSSTASKASQESMDSMFMPCEVSNPRRCGAEMAKTLEAACSGMEIPSMSAPKEAEKMKVKMEDAGEESSCEHAKEAMKKACKKDKKTDKQGEKEQQSKLDKASKASKSPEKDKKDKKDKNKAAPTPMAKVGKSKITDEVKLIVKVKSGVSGVKPAKGANDVEA